MESLDDADAPGLLGDTKDPACGSSKATVAGTIEATTIIESRVALKFRRATRRSAVCVRAGPFIVSWGRVLVDSRLGTISISVDDVNTIEMGCSFLPWRRRW